MRKNGGHAGVGALLIVMDIDLADEHTRNVGNGVVLTGLQNAELDAVFTRTEGVFLSGNCTNHHCTGHGGGNQSLQKVHFILL